MVCVCACKKREGMHASVRVVMHTYAFLRIVTSIRTTPFVFLFFCLSLLLCFQLSIFLYAPFSLSPHFTNSLKRTFRILLVRPLFLHPSTPQHPIIAQKQQQNQCKVGSVRPVFHQYRVRNSSQQCAARADRERPHRRGAATASSRGRGSRHESIQGNSTRGIANCESM